MAVHVHDVVQVSRPAPLGQSPEFLSEQFGQRIAAPLVASLPEGGVIHREFDTGVFAEPS
jgi:hypothetical protein